MHPVTHPGAAYLLYAAWLRLADADRRTPSDGATLALVVGALLPDLVDKPLYHYGLLDVPSGRVLGHSLIFLVPLSVVAIVAVRRSSLPDHVGGAFAFGLLWHAATDAVPPILFGQFDELGFLLWPVTHSPPYVGYKPLFEVAGVTVTTMWVDFLVLAAALVVWWRDGRPGLAPLRNRVGR